MGPHLNVLARALELLPKLAPLFAVHAKEWGARGDAGFDVGDAIGELEANAGGQGAGLGVGLGVSSGPVFAGLVGDRVDQGQTARAKAGLDHLGRDVGVFEDVVEPGGDQQILRQRAGVGVGLTGVFTEAQEDRLDRREVNGVRLIVVALPWWARVARAIAAARRASKSSAVMVTSRWESGPPCGALRSTQGAAAGAGTASKPSQAFLRSSHASVSALLLA